MMETRRLQADAVRLAALLAVLLAWVSAAPAAHAQGSPPFTLTGGGGASWTVVTTGGTSNGRPTGGVCNASPGLSVADAALTGGDAFDHALVVFVNDTIFAPGSVTQAGPIVSAGPQTLAGLNVSAQYQALANSPALRTLVSLTNPTGTVISASVAVATNVGSDGTTVVLSTSSGDQTVGAGDRWVVTADHPTVPHDDVIVHVVGGPGTPRTPAASLAATAFECNGTQGLLATFPVSVPGNATRRLLFFHQLSADGAGAQSAATGFNTPPATGSPLLTGLGPSVLSEIVNWDLAAASGAQTTVPTTLNPPPSSGQGGVPCAGRVGDVCTIGSTGSVVSGSWTKSGSGRFTVTATGLNTVLVGGVPAVFLPTTAGVEAFACQPVTATFQTTCTGTTTGDLLQGATVTVRFPLAAGGTQDVTGTVSGPGAAPAPIAQAVALVQPLGLGVLAGLPLILPPLPILPPPPPLLPPPPVNARAALDGMRATGMPAYPEVPVIPEADSLALLGIGLAGLGALVGVRARRQRG